MGRRRDAALALGVLVPTLGAALAVGAPADPWAAALGVGGALGLELALSRRAAAVRRVWRRPTVQALAVALTGVAAVTAVLAVGPRALTALAAGLVTYLLVLAGATAVGR